VKTKSPATDFAPETYLPRIVALGLLAVLMLLAMTGCKNATPTAARIDPAGVYTLVSGSSPEINLSHYQGSWF